MIELKQNKNNVNKRHKVNSDKTARLNGRIVGIQPETEGGFVLEIYDGQNIVKCCSLKNCEVNRGDLVSLTLNEIKSEQVIDDLEIVTRAERRIPLATELESLGIEFRRKHHEVSMILDGTKKTFEQRSKVISFIRSFLETRGFLEVDTPYLQSVPEIAPVSDFITQPPRYFETFHLRITNTEYMRRLLVGGFDRIYQLGKCFRDEQPSFKHHPEFTQLTFGVANNSYDYLIDMLQELVYQTALNVFNKTRINFRGQQVDLTPPWKRITMREAIIEFAGIDIEDFPEDEGLAKKIKEIGVNLTEDVKFSGFLARNALIDRLVEDFIVPSVIQPTFIKEYPYCLGGPAKEVKERPIYKQRCEAFVGTMELANVSTPQNDYQKLKKWYDETLIQKKETGWHNQELDDDYLYAMSCGIPICTTGGLGIDRLLMLLLEKDDITDVILFPWKEARGEINRS